MGWSFRSVSRIDKSWRCDRLVVKQALDVCYLDRPLSLRTPDLGR